MKGEFPFEIVHSKPNAVTQAAIVEAERLLHDPKAKSFTFHYLSTLCKLIIHSSFLLTLRPYRAQNGLCCFVLPTLRPSGTQCW